MKKLNGLFSLLLCSVFVFGMVSCSGNTPGKISLSVWNHVKDGNYEKAVDTWFKHMETEKDLNKEEQEQKKELIKMFSGKIQQATEIKGGIKSVELTEENINESGDSATTTVLITYNDGSTDEQEMDFVKVNGDWKISMEGK